MSKEASGQAVEAMVEGMFGPQAEGRQPPPPALGGRPRIQRPDRHQVVMRWAALDELLPDDHQARVVWAFVEASDLSGMYGQIKAVQDHGGRPPIDPAILMALWLYATLDAVGSAREVERLCGEHKAYEWICGGVGVNYHTLSDFRTQQRGFLDKLLTDSVAGLMHEGLVTLQRVAQDGVRVRASAGASSFRRGPTLEECQAQAREQVQKLREELEADPAGVSRRQRAARERAARERLERVERAAAEVREIERKRREKKPEQADAGRDDEQGPDAGQGKKKPAEPRASTTDATAKVMKMPEGGFRPAFNVQFATDTGAQIVTGVEVGNVGSDQGQMAPMVEQHQERYGRVPDEVLVDGGFNKQADIEAVSVPGVTVYTPVPKPRKADQDPHQRRRDDSDVIAEWRERMGTDEAKAIYKERAATAECVNAIARNRGLRQFLVRGLEKVRAVALWFALAHNLVRAAALRAEMALASG